MDEHRACPRMEDQDYAMVTVVSSPSAAPLEKKTFMCLTKDLSVRGLQFSTFVDMPVGTMLDLRIAFQHPVRVFNHAAKVVWTRAQEDASYSVGVEFQDSPQGHMAEWKAFVMQMLDGTTRTPVE